MGRRARAEVGESLLYTQKIVLIVLNSSVVVVMVVVVW